MTGSFAGDGDIHKAAQRRAAVRRSGLEAMLLYGGNVRTKSKLSAGCSQIAVPGGRPGDARRPSALIPRLVFSSNVPLTRSNLPLSAKH
jgi:hypothetical protein